MMESLERAHIGPKIEENEEPVKNLIETFDKIYYTQGTVTSQSKFGRSQEMPEGRQRPLFTRKNRADTYKEFLQKPKDSPERQELINEARLRDQINERYLNQSEVTVQLEYGELKARIVDIIPPEGTQNLESKNRAPIFLIPGISNDIDCVSAFITEEAYRGRRIICCGYPESFMGQTTEKFAESVEKDTGFKPHIEFFKSVIDEYFKNNEEIELYGYSTGAPIVAGILNEKKYQDRVKNSALLFPAASVNQTVNGIKIGALHELGFVKDNSSAPLNITIASKKPQEKEQIKLRNRIMGSLMKKISVADTDWQSAHVKENGVIIVVSGGKDTITKSAQISDDFEKGNEQIKSSVIPNAYHATFQLQPKVVLDKISEMEKE